MTRPPSRADQVRMMGGGSGANVQASAKMTAIDMENPNVHADAWFAYIMPTQVGVQLVGAGRYGYWERQPDVEHDGDCIVVTGRSDATVGPPEPGSPSATIAHDDGPGGDEPILVVPKAAVVSVLLAKAKHVEASPFPVVPVQEPGK
jgi:hypothetical protein